MRAKSILLLMLALGCGLVASIGITQVMAKRSADAGTESGETQAILVALKDIPMGDPITAQVVKLETRPVAYVPPGAFGDLKEVENRRAKAAIPANMPITEVVLQGTSDQLASDSIPKGHRVVAVKVDSQTAGGNLIRPGDCVDVLVHLKADLGRGGITKTTTRTILQSIKVFAVNDIWSMETGAGDKSIAAKTISLLVKPEQAETVTLASELGTIRLVLRSPDDRETKQLPGRDANELVGLPSSAGSESPGSAAGDLLKLLAAQKAMPPAPKVSVSAPAVIPVPDTKTFNMRILAGSHVTDMVLETQGDSDKTKDSASQFEFWRISSVTPVGTGPVAHASPMVIPTATPLPPPEPPPVDKDKDRDKETKPKPKGSGAEKGTGPEKGAGAE